MEAIMILVVVVVLALAAIAFAVIVQRLILTGRMALRALVGDEHLLAELRTGAKFRRVGNEVGDLRRGYDSGRRHQRKPENPRSYRPGPCAHGRS